MTPISSFYDLKRHKIGTLNPCPGSLFPLLRATESAKRKGGPGNEDVSHLRKHKEVQQTVFSLKTCRDVLYKLKQILIKNPILIFVLSTANWLIFRDNNRPINAACAKGSFYELSKPDILNRFKCCLDTVFWFYLLSTFNTQTTLLQSQISLKLKRENCLL